MISIIDCLLTRDVVVTTLRRTPASSTDSASTRASGSCSATTIWVAAPATATRYGSGRKQNGGVLVVTEGVFGMKGDLGKLDEIVALKKDFQFRLLVDDAHGFGTMGPGGRGTAAHFGVVDGVDVLFNTFAKSMAGIGAFVKRVPAG